MSAGNIGLQIEFRAADPFCKEDPGQTWRYSADDCEADGEGERSVTTTKDPASKRSDRKSCWLRRILLFGTDSIKTGEVDEEEEELRSPLKITDTFVSMIVPSSMGIEELSGVLLAVAPDLPFLLLPFPLLLPWEGMASVCGYRRKLASFVSLPRLQTYFLARGEEVKWLF